MAVSPSTSYYLRLTLWLVIIPAIFFRLLNLFLNSSTTLHYTFRESHPQVIVLASDIHPSQSQIESYIRQVFGSQAEEALAVARCESGITQERVNKNTGGTEDSGVFQINDVHIKQFGDYFKYDFKENVRVAYSLFREQDWNPWAASNGCHKLLSE